MKYFNRFQHICGDCGTSPCPYHDENEMIDGWTAEEYDLRYGQKAMRVFKCPKFTDDSECRSCVDRDICKLKIAYGMPCEKHIKRAKARDKQAALTDYKSIIESLSADELFAFATFVHGISICEVGTKQTKEIVKMMNDRLKRRKDLRKKG